MDIDVHIKKAEQYLVASEDRSNDPAWALVEVECTKAHVMLAAVKLANSIIGAKPIGGVLKLVSKVAR